LRLPVEVTDRTTLVSSIHPSPIIAETRDLTPSRRLDGVHVLLAEDGVDNQRLVTAILRRAGATVDVADNGLIALQRALQAQAEQPYDVVLMDMEMSELDGYGATARLRAAGYPTPMVALTAHAMQAHRDRALAAGCNEHLTKPIDRAALIDTVARLAGGDAAQRPAPALTPALAPTPIFSALADDEDIAALLPSFCDNLRIMLTEIAVSLAHDDRVALARVAHQLAGAGGSYGFDDITTAARQLEVGLRAKAEDIAPHVSALVKLCEGALAAHDA
jgi:CheY-like chemotaxis protein